jgi:hypothetical protein
VVATGFFGRRRPVWDLVVRSALVTPWACA